MAIGTGDSVRKFSATTVTLEASGGSITNGSIGAADDDTYDLTDTDHADCPHAMLAISVACSSAFDANGLIRVVIQSLNVDGANNEPDPTNSYWPRTSGLVQVKNQTATQYAEIAMYNIPRQGKVWLLNSTGQTISSGWTAKLTPFAYGPAA